MIDQREVVFQTTGHGARDIKKNNVTSKEIEKIISFCIQKSVGKLSKLSMPNIEKYGLDATFLLMMMLFLIKRLLRYMLFRETMILKKW